MTTRPRKRAAARQPAAQRQAPPPPVEIVEPVDEDPPPTNVIEALARVQKMMGGIEKLTPEQRRARGLAGSDESEGRIKYPYRGIDQIEARVQKLFGRYGIVTLGWVETYDVSEPFRMGQSQTLWTDHTMAVLWTIYGPGGKDDFLTVRTIGLGRDNSDKGANKAYTGAAKNFLLKLLHIGDPSDDPDTDRHETIEPPPPPPEAPDPRTPAEIGVRDAVSKMTPDQRKRFVDSFVNQFGKRLLDLDPEKHGDALAWTTEWVEADSKATESESEPEATKPPPDGSDGGPGHADPLEQPELGDALADGLDPDAVAAPVDVDDPEPPAEPVDAPAKAPMPDGCDFVGTRCRAHKRPAAECRAEFGAGQAP